MSADDMGLTNDSNDTVSSLGGSESDSGASPELIDHINSVLSPSYEDDKSADVADTASAEKPAVNENVQRQVAANRQQQKDELVEEGLSDENGNEPTLEATDENKEPEAGVEAPAEDAAVETAELDPNLRFVAQFYGWDDARIDKLFAADPELATGTFEQLLNAFQAMSRQQGVGTLPPNAQQQRTQNPGPMVAQPNTQGSQLEALFANPKAFADANGEQLGQLLVGLQKEVYSPLQTALKQVAQIQAEYMVQKQQAVAAEATSATAGLAQKFPDVYGTDTGKLNLFQQQARQNLFTVADQMRAGAYQQGREMTVSDALNRAHLIVTAGKQQQQARQAVRSQVQQRSRKITARPTQRTNPRGVGVAQGNEAAASAYATRAAELGVSIGD